MSKDAEEHGETDGGHALVCARPKLLEGEKGEDLSALLILLNRACHAKAEV